MASMDVEIRKIAIQWLMGKGMREAEATSVVDDEISMPRSAIGKEQSEAILVAKFVMQDRNQRR